jgi:dTDP-4-amino-4,6-dideoxygalactose transaminase
MVQALRAMEARPGSLCVMPSWTFVATAAAACAAGLQPFFVDVDPLTWAISPASVSGLIGQGMDVGAVIVVAPFGAPLDLRAWEEFHGESGVPVLIDAAAGFDSFSRVGTSLPFMVSLHATKVFGVGEGAVVVTGEPELSLAVRRAGNFGFLGTREAETAGLNAKLSEYTAAVGLAGLDAWPGLRERWQDVTSRFSRAMENISGVSCAPGFGDGWISSYGNVRLSDGRGARDIGEALAQRGVETRMWWGEGCHAQPAYRMCGRSELPHTADLADRVIGLPFWAGLDDASLDHVFGCLGDILEGRR